MSRRRAVAAMGAVVGGALLLSGCNTSALTKREVVVYFNQTASNAEHVDALRACAHSAPDATPEPLASAGGAADVVGDVRFRVDHASDKDLATLYSCLHKQAGVVGVDIPDLTD